jgi:copper resistance protein C
MISRILFATAILAALAGPAWAHAFLEHASPGAGATDATAPKKLTLEFTENLEPTFSGVTISDKDGHSVEQGAPVVSGATITVALKPLGAGSYHVAWHAVSTDSHRTEGSYSFSVKP